MDSPQNPFPKPGRMIISLEKVRKAVRFPSFSRKAKAGAQVAQPARPPGDVYPAAAAVSPGAGAASRGISKGLKILIAVALVLLVLVAVLAIGAYLYWQNYKTRPAYTLAL